MKYISDINDIKTSDVLLESNRSGSILPEAIQWFQGNKWNHSGMFIWLWGELFVCEAEKRGICLTPFADYIAGNYDIKILKYNTPFDDATVKKMSRFMLSKCGNVPYDFINLIILQPIKYIWKKLTGKEIWVGTKDEKKSERRFSCAKWCAFIYHEFTGKFPLWMEIAPEDFDESTDFTQYLFVRPQA